MSGWTVITMVASRDYEHSRYDNDYSDAYYDIAATAEADKRVRHWKTGDGPHVYAYLNCSRYNWEFAEAFMQDYWPMLDCAVVVGANDTTDTGTARYYGSPTNCTDEYAETQTEDGCHVGKIAMQVIGGRHGVVVRDPFHDWQMGYADDRALENGTNREEYHD